jgi:integrase
MYRHGLRVSEAVDLRWTDFDLDAPRDRPFWVRRLKGSKGTTHTLEPDTARLLLRAKKRAEGIYVFRSERGGKLSTDIVRVICERAGQAVGFEFRVRPHIFRHAAGFALAEEGTDTRLIQDFLGHKEIKSTVIYTETSQRRRVVHRPSREPRAVGLDPCRGGFAASEGGQGLHDHRCVVRRTVAYLRARTGYCDKGFIVN